MPKLSVLSLVCFVAAGLSGCCTHRAPTLAEAPPVCSPIQCGSCGCPQVSQGVPAYSDGVAAPVITGPSAAPSLSPGATAVPSLSPPPPSLGIPSTSPGPTTYAPSGSIPATPAPGNLPANP